MAYQALYRKYRPRSFEEVVGQKQIVQTLQNAVKTNRIAHAYLFTGPRGTGKTSIAKIFARTLNCTGENKPCMKCENCLASLNGQHPDIIEIDAASNNGVDEVRSLIDRVGYSPMEGKYKVYIIDEVHMMSPGAFNALLKTIEEPPAHVIFILATTEPNKVLPTVLSRCQRFDFSKVMLPDMCRRISQVCQEEHIEIEEDAVNLIATFADGGMRDALSILDQCYAYCSSKITADDVREIYGVIREEDIGRIFQSLNLENIDTAMEMLEHFQNKGFDLKRFLSDFISLLKDSLLYDLSPQSAAISEQRRTLLQTYFSASPANMKIQMLNELMNVYTKLSYASNIFDYVQTTLLKMIFLQSDAGRQNQISTVQKSRRPAQKISESRSEPAETKPKTKEKSSSHPLADKFWASDVSRETSNPQSDENSDSDFDENFLLSLLVGADKNSRKADEEQYSNLPLYENSLEFGKFATSLKGTNLIASAEQYLLVQAKNQMKANLINRLQKDEGYEILTGKMLSKKKKVFAVAPDKRQKLIETFKQRSKEGTLPAPAKFDEMQKQEVKEQSTPDYLKTLFSDLQVVDD